MNWTHKDPQLSLSVADGLDRLSRATWDAGANSNERALQGVCALKAILCGYLLGGIQTSGSNEEPIQRVDVDVETTQGERADACRTLLSPLVCYGMAARLKNVTDSSPDLVTLAPSDSGAWPIAVVVVAVIAGGAVCGWVAHEAAQVVKYFKGANDQMKLVEQADAQATKIMSEHIQREQQAGAQLPFSEAEKAILQMLQTRSNAAAAALNAANQPGAPSTWDQWKPVIFIGAGAAAVIGVIALASRRAAVTLVQPAKAA